MNKLKKYTVTGTIIISVLGTLLHFVYNFTGQNFLVGLFTPINESTWEHMKLVFFPMLLFWLLTRKRFLKISSCSKSAYLFSTLLGTLLIPVLFYTYTGILGYNISAIDISTFFISVIITFYIFYKNANSCKFEKYKSLLIFLNLLFAVAFIICTVNPPKLGIFVSPV